MVAGGGATAADRSKIRAPFLELFRPNGRPVGGGFWRGGAPEGEEENGTGGRPNGGRTAAVGLREGDAGVGREREERESTGGGDRVERERGERKEREKRKRRKKKRREKEKRKKRKRKKDVKRNEVQSSLREKETNRQKD